MGTLKRAAHAPNIKNISRPLIKNILSFLVISNTRNQIPHIPVLPLQSKTKWCRRVLAVKGTTLWAAGRAWQLGRQQRRRDLQNLWMADWGFFPKLQCPRPTLEKGQWSDFTARVNHRSFSKSPGRKQCCSCSAPAPSGFSTRPGGAHYKCIFATVWINFEEEKKTPNWITKRRE